MKTEVTCTYQKGHLRRRNKQLWLQSIKGSVVKEKVSDCMGECSPVIKSQLGFWNGNGCYNGLIEVWEVVNQYVYKGWLSHDYNTFKFLIPLIFFVVARLVSFEKLTYFKIGRILRFIDLEQVKDKFQSRGLSGHWADWRALTACNILGNASDFVAGINSA